MHILNELTYINNTSLALGFFDGIHQGHRVVLQNTIHTAKKTGSQSCVILFKEHPNNILTNNKTEQILTLDEKLSMLEKIGIDNVILLNFEDYQNMRAKDYLKDVLVKYFSPKSITTGFNHIFGYNREGDSNLLKEYSSIYGYEYYEIPPYVINETLVSSSQIRNKIKLGNFQDANKLLGYNFFIQGIVIKGEQLASKIGFPSANIEYPKNKIEISHGVYYVKTEIASKEYDGIYNWGIINSNNGEKKLKSEVHILNFDKNIYGEKIKISLVAKIRNQTDFATKEKLQFQIKRDIAFATIYKHYADSAS